MQKLKILMASAELNPIAKVGGLGDVIGALPKSLAVLNCDVRIFLPFYGFIDRKQYKIKKIISDIKFDFDGSGQTFSIWQMNLPNTTIPVYLVKHKYFDGKAIYKGSRLLLDKKYTRTPTDVMRFNFFSQAVLEATKNLSWRPDIIHCHDWHVATIPGYIKNFYHSDIFFRGIKTLFTVHNLANQGIATMKSKDSKKFSSLLSPAESIINFMEQGIISSDLLNTVSPTYAKEILNSEQGAGLNKLLRTRKKDLFGVLNGIDTEMFNPKTDQYVKYKYDINNLSKKSQNKQVLQKLLGLKQDKQLVLVGVISRFVNQKGLELINKEFAKLNCQFVFLGSGQSEIEEKLLKLSKKFPNKFSAQIKFDVKLAQQIYAGADIFLMPSKFEPCGLGQMIAMRYGTVPVVRATGGLADTVNSKVGFSFKQYNSGVLYKTLERALKVYYNQPNKWLNLQKTCMIKDFSWAKPAKEYLKLYNKLAKIK